MPTVDPQKQILVVEDDPHIADLLCLHLGDEHYAITHARDGHEGLAQLTRQAWDALVLDVMLPGVDGLELCKHARTLPRYLPTIIISARSSEVHRVLGLELGADDYLAKPFSMVELVARVKALLRRSDAMASQQRADAGVFQDGTLRIDPLTRIVRLGDQTIDLTPREFDLLYFFARHPGRVYSRMDLLDHVWGYLHDGYEHTVNTHIHRLRAKIETDPAQPERIQTLWGRGYRFSLLTAPDGHGRTP